MSQPSEGAEPPSRAVPGTYRKRGYRHTASAAFYGVYVASAIGFAAFVLRKLGAGALECQVVSLAQAVPLLLSFLWLPFVEHRNPARTIGLLWVVGGATLLFSGLRPSIEWFVTVLFLGVLLGTASAPLTGVTLQQIYPRRWRGKLMSLPSSVSMLMRVAGLLCLGALLDRDVQRYRYVFPAAGASLIIAGLIFRGLPGSRGLKTSLETSVHDSPAERLGTALRTAFRNRPLVVFITGYFITTCGAVLTFNTLPIYANDVLELTSKEWGYVRAGFMTAALVSFFVWGRFMDRFGAPLTMVVSWVLQLGTFVALFYVTGPRSLFVAVAVRGFFQSANIIAFHPIVMHFTASSDTGRGMSLHYLFWGVRWICMPLTVAWIVNGAFMPMKNVFLLTAVLIVIGTFVMATVWYDDKQQRIARERIRA